MAQLESLAVAGQRAGRHEEVSVLTGALQQMKALRADKRPKTATPPDSPRTPKRAQSSGSQASAAAATKQDGQKKVKPTKAAKPSAKKSSKAIETKAAANAEAAAETSQATKNGDAAEKAAAAAVSLEQVRYQVRGRYKEEMLAESRALTAYIQGLSARDSAFFDLPEFRLLARRFLRFSAEELSNEALASLFKDLPAASKGNVFVGDVMRVLDPAWTMPDDFKLAFPQVPAVAQLVAKDGVQNQLRTAASTTAVRRKLLWTLDLGLRNLVDAPEFRRIVRQCLEISPKDLSDRELTSTFVQLAEEDSSCSDGLLSGYALLQYLAAEGALHEQSPMDAYEASAKRTEDRRAQQLREELQQVEDLLSKAAGIQETRHRQRQREEVLLLPQSPSLQADSPAKPSRTSEGWAKRFERMSQSLRHLRASFKLKETAWQASWASPPTTPFVFSPTSQTPSRMPQADTSSAGRHRGETGKTSKPPEHSSQSGRSPRGKPSKEANPWQKPAEVDARPLSARGTMLADGPAGMLADKQAISRERQPHVAKHEERGSAARGSAHGSTGRLTPGRPSKSSDAERDTNHAIAQAVHAVAPVPPQALALVMQKPPSSSTARSRPPVQRHVPGSDTHRDVRSLSPRGRKHAATVEVMHERPNVEAHMLQKIRNRSASPRHGAEHDAKVAVASHSTGLLGAIAARASSAERTPRQSAQARRGSLVDALTARRCSLKIRNIGKKGGRKPLFLDGAADTEGSHVSDLRDELEKQFKNLAGGANKPPADSRQRRSSWPSRAASARSRSRAPEEDMALVNNAVGDRRLGISMEGEGVMYSGQWKKGPKRMGVQKGPLRDGYGALLFDGGVYEGEWVDDKAHGKGCVHFKNGDIFSGKYVLNKKHGAGTYQWTDGATEEGEYLNDSKTGWHRWQRGDDRWGLEYEAGAVVAMQRLSSGKGSEKVMLTQNDAQLAALRRIRQVRSASRRAGA
eukprot:TRINITY_DN9870_c0_g1_i2.p1 TRINITY_DN9870_c0_g1~~TRINITY_DN9870_c0_g1_i2.p1  ORF type:complete len:1132 (+),score=221.80 TRINITY_DN9870_c0_g1_i2:481-3396(+)